MSERIDFGARLAELEAITSWFESSEVNVDEGLKKFERGMQLATELRAHLAKTENEVHKIKQKFSGADAADSGGSGDHPGML
jgi:exodeoxyribonuclease VII small subunit